MNAGDPTFSTTPTLLASLALDLGEVRRLLRPPYSLADSDAASRLLCEAQNTIAELQRRATKGAGQ